MEYVESRVGNTPGGPGPGRIAGREVIPPLPNHGGVVLYCGSCCGECCTCEVLGG